MPGPIEAAGAARNPTRYGALGMGGRQFTGIWTQRSPYRDAATPYLVAKFYSGSRFDSIWDGLNREISQRMTDVRRPGSVVYNANVFPPANSFYSWKYIQDTQEIVRVILDGTDGTIYDATAGQKTALYAKATGAGEARFLGVNTELFFSDAVEQKKILRSALVWGAAKTFTAGDFILDTNGNIQSFQSQATSIAIAQLQIIPVSVGEITQNFLIVTATAAVPTIPSNQPISFSGINAAAYEYLNGTTVNYANPAAGWNLNLSDTQFALMTNVVVTPQTASAGTAATYIQVDSDDNPITGVTGNAEPAWAAAHGTLTQDGTVTWMCFGSPVQDWGVKAATSAPSVSPGPTAQYWSAKLDISAKPQYGYAIIDANGQLQIPFGVGITGSEQPIWSTQLGGKTVDGTVIWMNVGQLSTWFPKYQFPDTITAIIDPNNNLQVTFDYFTTQTTWTDGIANTTGAGNTTGTTQPGAVVPAQSRGSSYYLQSPAPGEEGAGNNVTVYYSDLTEAGPDTNLVNAFNAFLAGGPPVTLNFSFTGAPTTIGPENIIVTGVGTGSPPTQPRSFAYFTFTTGSSAAVYYEGSGHPGYTANYVGVNSETTWNTTLGGTTLDNAYTWYNCGPATQLTAGTLQYAQCYHSIDGTVSTASPLSYVLNPMVGAPGMFGVQLQLTPSDDLQVDQIWIMRTAGGKPTLVYVDEIPNVGPNATFGYMDVIPDTSTSGQQALIPEIPAPIADEADPPQKGMVGAVYAFQRIFAIVDNQVVWSAGPDAVTGNGNTQFPPLNYIPYAAQPIFLLPITVQNGGVLVYTTDGIYIILGTGQSGNSFYSSVYFSTVSVSGWRMDVYNQQVCVMESNGKVSMQAIEYPFNPQTGYTEIGFPIGDQFKKTTTGGFDAAIFNPATVSLSWNIASSGDTGMYVANNEGQYFRMSIVNAPESGLLWSPIGSIAGGSSCIQNTETAPGQFGLLMAPATGGTGPILMRDQTGEVFEDDGTAYPAWDVKGVNLLCSTGQWAEVAHISAKSVAVGKRPIVSVLMNEIAPSPKRPYTVLDLATKSQDPPRNKPSISVFSDRYVLSQNGMTKTGDCILVKFDYGTQAEPDELYDWNIFAAVHDEREEAAAKA